MVDHRWESTSGTLPVLIRKTLIQDLEAQPQVSKNGVLKSIVQVIKHASFEFYWAYTCRVVWKNLQSVMNK